MKPTTTRRDCTFTQFSSHHIANYPEYVRTGTYKGHSLAVRNTNQHLGEDNLQVTLERPPIMSAEHIETAHLVDETPVPPVNDPVMMTDESALPASDDVQPLEAVDENQGVSGETVVSDAEQPSPQDPPDDNESSSSSQDDGTVSSTNEGVRREANEHEEVPSEGGEATADSPNKLHRPRTPTRARGSSGIPPKTKLQLEDLRDLPKEEIARALYEDPELAQQAAAAAAQREELKPPVTQPTVKPKQQKRKAQVPSTKTTREELLKDRGFPVFQWIVLSLLAGLLAYQLIKSFQAAPPKKSTAGKTHKTASSAKARDTKESRSKKNSGKSDPAKKKGTSAENSQSTSAEKVAENTAHTPESTIAAETVEINKKETKKKSPKAKRKCHCSSMASRTKQSRTLRQSTHQDQQRMWHQHTRLYKRTKESGRQSQPKQIRRLLLPR